MKKAGGKTIIVLILLGIMVLGGLYLYRVGYDRRMPNFRKRFELFVKPGTSVQEVMDSLMVNGRCRNTESLQRTLGHAQEVKPGHYTVDPGCTSMYVTRMLTNGWQTPVNLTVSGSIRSTRALARKIGAQMLVDSKEVLAFMKSADSLAPYGVDTSHVFCLILQDTYQMKWTASVRDIFDRLNSEHDSWWTAERRSKAKKLGLTPDQVVTLASIVDGESHYLPEQPTIAGVYLNRLAKGMKLQADPTVNYCFGYSLKRILKRHLEIDSPYNTYRYEGLPPGPISCPPKSCLEAVLNPEKHNYLYFCADPSFNGSHRFAATYEEHMRNARAFQDALNHRK